MDRREFCLASMAAAAVPAAKQDVAKRRAIAPADGTYAQAHEVVGARRMLFVSGQVPADENGDVPADFADQCRLAWRNVQAQLAAADMGFEHLAKVTIYLADRRYREQNREVRQQVLGKLRNAPAITVVIAGIYDEAWLLEIEAIAVA